MIQALRERIPVKLSSSVQILAVLVLGILVGTAGAHFLQPATLDPWLSAAGAVIRLWTNALRLVVTPLVVAQIFVAVASHRGAKTDAAKLGLLIPAVFIGLMLFTALATVATTRGVLGLRWFSGITLIGSGEAALPTPGNGGAASTPWTDSLIPPNLFAAASSDSIMALILFSLAFAIAARSVAPELRQALDRGFSAVRDILFVIVGWLLRVAPLALFALAFQSAARTGLQLGQLMLGFVAISTIATLVGIAACYPLATLVGRISLVRFARAVFPAQITAAATRSSLATLPALLRESDTTLRLPTKVSALVLPLAGALLKPSRAVNNVVKFLLLGHLLGLHLGFRQIAIFVLIVLLLSPSTVGVPNVMSGSRTLPAYVAAGIPPEYVILLGATVALLDVGLTILNTTGYMTANVLVARLLNSNQVQDPGLPPQETAGFAPQSAAASRPEGHEEQ